MNQAQNEERAVNLRALAVCGHPGQVGVHGDAGPVTEHVMKIECRILSSCIRAAKVVRMPLFVVRFSVRPLFLSECGKASENSPINRERRYGQYRALDKLKKAGFGTAPSG